MYRLAVPETVMIMMCLCACCACVSCTVNLSTDPVMLKSFPCGSHNPVMVLLQAKRRLLLTGTQLQNNLLELMSLLSFVISFKQFSAQIRNTFSRARVSDSIGGCPGVILNDHNLNLDSPITYK